MVAFQLLVKWQSLKAATKTIWLASLKDLLVFSGPLQRRFADLCFFAPNSYKTFVNNKIHSLWTILSIYWETLHVWERNSKDNNITKITFHMQGTIVGAYANIWSLLCIFFWSNYVFLFSFPVMNLLKTSSLNHLSH